MIKPTSRLRDMLTGSSFASLDDRGRLVLPSKVLPNLRALSGVTGNEELEVAVTVSMEDVCLGIYPVPILEEFAAKLAKAPNHDAAAVRQRKMLSKYLEYLEVDKQGRLKLPAVLLELFGLNGDLVLVGAEDHLQIWPKKEGMPQLKQEIEGTGARTTAVLSSDWMKSLDENPALN